MRGHVSAVGRRKGGRGSWARGGTELREGAPRPRRKGQSGWALMQRVKLTGTMTQVGHQTGTNRI